MRLEEIRGDVDHGRIVAFAAQDLALELFGAGAGHSLERQRAVEQCRYRRAQKWMEAGRRELDPEDATAPFEHPDEAR